MHGNVSEWCADTAKGRGGLLEAMTRGGDWFHSAEHATVGGQGSYDVATTLTRLGLRVARFPANVASDK
jgi:formylglycine-generating enzyme required for sulfatase activity